jgi:LysM repeat protein
MFGPMKRISILLAGLVLCAAPISRGQDAATQQRLNELEGQIQNLLETQEMQRKQIADLTRQLALLQDQQNKPQPNYASADDLKRLADATQAGFQQVDRKRAENDKKIQAELLKLGKALAAPLPVAPRRSARQAAAGDSNSSGSKTGYYYTVQSGDYLSAIAKAYRDQQHIKVTWRDIVKANPGLNPAKLPVGRKIFIPAPEP